MCRGRVWGQDLSITGVLLAFRIHLIEVNSPCLQALWPYISTCFIKGIIVLSLTGEESEKLRNQGLRLRNTQVFDFNRISLNTASLSGVLGQELNPQIYSPFAQSEHRGNVEGGFCPPLSFWVSREWTHRPQCSQESAQSWGQALSAYPETWAFGTGTKGCRWNASSNHQNCYNREGEIPSGCLDHPRDNPWAAVTPLRAQHKTCLWTEHILAKTLLLVRF